MPKNMEFDQMFATSDARNSGVLLNSAQVMLLSSSGLDLKTMLGAARRVAAALLTSGLELRSEVRDHLDGLVNADKTADHYEELDALRKVRTP